MSGRAIVMPSRAVMRSMPRSPANAGSAQETKEHCLRLIVGVMSGHERVGADRLRVIDEQAVARLACALLQAARWLHAFPLKNAMADPEPGAERGDGFRLVRAFRPKPVVDRRRLDPRLAAPLRPFGRHQQQRGRIGAARDGDQKRLRPPERGEQRVDVSRRETRASAGRSTMILGALMLGELLHRGRRGRVALAEFVSVAQACSELPSAASVCPSRTMLSGARDDLE